MRKSTKIVAPDQHMEAITVATAGPAARPHARPPQPLTPQRPDRALPPGTGHPSSSDAALMFPVTSTSKGQRSRHSWQAMQREARTSRSA